MPRHPVGTGPFRFVQWNPGDRIVLAANDDYWAGRPRIDRLIYKVIPDSSSRLIQLASGQIHAMDGLNPNDLPVVQRNDRLQLLQFPGINVCYLSMNCEKPPFTDVRVRRAIAMAIRKEDLIESVYRGTAIPAILPMPPIVFGFDKSIEDYPNDIEAAKRLLAEYRDAFRATMGVTPNGPPPTPLENLLDLLVMPNPRPYLPDPIRAAELIKGDLERLGLKIRITVSGDWGTHLAKTRNGEHQMALLGWVSDNGDPDNFLGVLLGSEQARKGAALNISFYKNPALDDLLQQARRELDTAKRAALYHQAQKIIHDDCPMVPLAHAVDSVAMHRNVHGLVLQPTGDLRFHHVRLER
jgi:ABC-type transport system substrate-binding protein